MEVYTIISIILAILSFGIILFIGIKTDILRESPPNDQFKNHMYSLGRFQFWIWTLVICPIFVLFWGFDLVHTIDLNSTAVLLLGIPAGVTVTSHIISSSQASDLTSSDHIKAQVATQATPQTATTATASDPATAATPVSPQEDQSPTILKMHRPSKSFFVDLISDDSGQLSLARLQQLIFTMVFIVIYISTFFSKGMQVLPEFENQVFMLMGISSGTYLVSKGLKK